MCFNFPSGPGQVIAFLSNWRLCPGPATPRGSPHQGLQMTPTSWKLLEGHSPSFRTHGAREVMSIWDLWQQQQKNRGLAPGVCAYKLAQEGRWRVRDSVSMGEGAALHWLCWFWPWEQSASVLSHVVDPRINILKVSTIPSQPSNSAYALELSSSRKLFTEKGSPTYLLSGGSERTTEYSISLFKIFCCLWFIFLILFT